jgi:peptide/nickel transport system permease protein
VAVSGVGGRIAEAELWTAPRERSTRAKVLLGILTFARKKPLGFVCGLMVLALIIVGDLVPVTINGALELAGVNARLPYVADAIAPYRYDKINLGERLEGSSRRHLLGSDELGRDTFSRLIYGARVSVIVPVGAVLITEFLAATIGIMSAYYAGWVDKISQRLVDIFQALPGLVVLITVLGLFGSGLWQLIVVIGVLGGPPASRIIRGQVLSIMATPYIEAARVVGAGDGRIMFRYVLPNVMALIILGSTLRLGMVVLLEASLSFLGYGLPPPFPSWGQMLSLQGREFMRVAPGLAIYPGLAIGLVVFSYNLFGDALRDTLDPRLRGSR